MRQELRIAARSLARAPQFAIAAVAVIALAAGGAAGIWGVVRAALYHSPTVPHAGQLVLLTWREKGELPPQIFAMQTGYDPQWSFSWPAYLAMRRASNLPIFGFVPLGGPGAGIGNVTVTSGATAFQADGEMVTGDFFPGLGLRAAIGRLLAERDGRSSRSVVISYSLWVKRFGASRAALGQQIFLDGQAYTIAGVGPRGFAGLQVGRRVELWIPMAARGLLRPWGIPLAATGGSPFVRRRWWWLNLMVRVPAGERSEALARLQTSYRSALAAGCGGCRLSTLPVLELGDGRWGIPVLGSELATGLWLLEAIMAIALLVGAANLAALYSARVALLSPEITVRTQLGAGRWGLFRRLAAEGVLLLLAGAAVASAVAPGVARVLEAALGSVGLPAPAELAVGWTAAPWAWAAAAVMGLLCFAPAAWRGSVAARLAAGKRPFRRQRPLFQILVAAQIAGTLVLLLGCLPFVTALLRMRGLPLGFQPRNLVLVQVAPSAVGRGGAALLAYAGAAAQNIERVPGAASVAEMEIPLLSGTYDHGSVRVPGAAPPPGGVYWDQVSPEFLRTMGIPLVLGADLGPGQPRTVVLGRSAAREMFGHANPVGRTVLLGGQPFTVTGVAADAQYRSRSDQGLPVAYFPLTTEPLISGLYIAVRFQGPHAAFLRELRRSLWAHAPELASEAFTSQSALDARAVALPRIFAVGPGALGLLSLLLASLGVGGAVAGEAVRRRHEIGLRIALGATDSRAVRPIFARCLGTVLAGAAIGIFLGWAADALVISQMPGASAPGGLLAGALCAAVVAVGILAGYNPARRAARQEPWRLLREP